MDSKDKSLGSRPPETPTQKYLARLWAEVLEIDQVGRDDNFFELGGDSLKALEVYDQICERYRQEIPQLDMRWPSTILTLAELIDNETGESHEQGYRALKRLQTGEPGRVPLFLVHGGDGNARAYQRLTANLDPRIPVYGFRWTGWDGKRSDHDFGAMARTYLDELRKMRPEGPYRLGGYCIGGIVALEMARLLREEGREIEGPLYIWDCPNVLSKTYSIREPWYSKKDRAAYDKMVEEFQTLRAKTIPDAEPPEIPQKFEGRYELLRRYPWMYTLARMTQIRIGTLPIRWWLLTGKSIPVKWRWIYCMTTCYFAMRRPIRTRYEGRVVYFRSDVLLWRKNLLGWWSDPFLGFRELCGSFEGYMIGSDHVEVLAEKAGAEIVNQTYFEL